MWEAACAANNYCNIARAPIGDYYVHICGGRHNAFLEQNVKPYEVEIGETVGALYEAQDIANHHWVELVLQYITTQSAAEVQTDIVARLLKELTAREQIYEDNGQHAKAMGFDEAMDHVRALTEKTPCEQNSGWIEVGAGP